MTKNSKTLIENVFRNIDNCSSSVETCPFSDHEAIYFNVVDSAGVAFGKQFPKIKKRT